MNQADLTKLMQLIVQQQTLSNEISATMVEIINRQLEMNKAQENKVPVEEVKAEEIKVEQAKAEETPVEQAKAEEIKVEETIDIDLKESYISLVEKETTITSTLRTLSVQFKESSNEEEKKQIYEQYQSAKSELSKVKRAINNKKFLELKEKNIMVEARQRSIDFSTREMSSITRTMRKELGITSTKRQTKSESAQPENAQPENAQPENVQPENTQPENAQPENAQPENAQPENVQPENTQPENAQPENVQPENVQPENTQPENAQPENAQPENAQPENVQPEINLNPSSYGRSPDRTVTNKALSDLSDRIATRRDNLMNDQVSLYEKVRNLREDDKEIFSRSTRRNLKKDPSNGSEEKLATRDRLAAEIKQMRSTYGTANNKEYQQRISQLQELDRQILGRGRARRIYKDILAKPATLCGGTYIELPAELLDLRFSASMSR